MEIGEVTTIGIEEKNRVIWLGSHITQLIRPVWVSLGKHGEGLESKLILEVVSKIRV